MKISKNSALGLVAVFAVLVLSAPVAGESVLVPFGQKAQWKYLDDGSNPGSAWQTPAFDDRAWKSGAAPLGYGDPGIETTVSFGPDPQRKQITTYFRHEFDRGAAEHVEQSVFRIRSDDGIVVYLNGKEVIRNNLPTGEIGRDTTAITALNDLDERLCRHFRVAGDRLVAGRNVLAVEVHQAEPASSDLFLDLDLRGYAADEDLRPVVAAKARPQTEAFLKEHRIPEGQRVLDGYMDGGRGSTVNSDGLVSTDREVIVVDRSRDESLRKHLEFARSEQLKPMTSLDRAALLAVYVDKVMAHVAVPRYCEPADRLLVAEYRGEPVLLGDVPRLCGSGVCRHRSLLFKLMADEAGLRVALVRGGFNTGKAVEKHAWNELLLEDGKRLVVDMMALPELNFPNTRTDAVGRYVDVKDTPIYGAGISR